MASETSKMRISKLQELCAEKRFDCAGLKKAQMLALLRHTDANAASDIAADASDSAVESDVEVESDGAADDSVAIGESEKIIALRLKLQLAQAERISQKERMEAEFVVMKHEEKLAETEWIRERERMSLLGAAGAASQIGTDGDGPSGVFRGHLPHMSDDTLAFFHALEKTFQLNNIAQSDWTKLLPSMLNAKAA